MLLPVTRKTAVLALFLARAATGFQFQSIASAAPGMTTDLLLNQTQMGALIGAYLLPGIFLALPGSSLNRYLTDRTLGVIGLILMVVSGAGGAIATNFEAAWVARLCGGVGAILIILVATRMIADLFDLSEVALPMALLQVSWPFGAMLALPIQAILVETMTWPASLASASCLTAVALAIFLAAIPEQRRKTMRDDLPWLMPRQLLFSIIAAGVIWGGINVASVMFFTNAPALLVRLGCAEPVSAPFIVGLSIWITILSIPAAGLLINKGGRPIELLILSSLVAAIALTLIALNWHPVTWCFVFGAAIGPLSSAALYLPTSILPPVQRPAGFGIFYTCFYLMMAFGPPFAGHLQDITNSAFAGIWLSTILLLAAIPLSLMIAVPHTRDRYLRGNGVR